MNTASGRGRPAKGLRRAALDDLELRHAERCGVARDARRAVRPRLDGDRRGSRMAKHPFDADRARARADIPQHLATARRERRERHGADVALGDLPVMLEHLVGEAAAQRHDLGAGLRHDLDADRVQGIDRRRARNPRRAHARQAFARPAHRLAHDEARAPHAALGEERGELARRRRRPRRARGCAHPAANAG